MIGCCWNKSSLVEVRMNTTLRKRMKTRSSGLAESSLSQLAISPDVSFPASILHLHTTIATIVSSLDYFLGVSEHDACWHISVTQRQDHVPWNSGYKWYPTARKRTVESGLCSQLEDKWRGFAIAPITIPKSAGMVPGRRTKIDRNSPIWLALRRLSLNDRNEWWLRSRLVFPYEFKKHVCVTCSATVPFLIKRVAVSR